MVNKIVQCVPHGTGKMFKHVGTPFLVKHLIASQRAHDVKMTSYQRRCDVMTSHRRRSDVIVMSCACWGEVYRYGKSVFTLLSSCDQCYLLSKVTAFDTRWRK